MSEFSVRRPVTVLMICLGLIVLGLISASKIPIELLPEIKIPNFTITTHYPGASAEEVEKSITIPIERSLSTVSGLYSTTSQSLAQQSIVELKFRSDVNFLETVSLLKDKIAEQSFPEGVSKPFIERSASSDLPIIQFAIRYKSGVNDLLKLKQKIQNELVQKVESVDGIALAQILGAPSRKINIVFNESFISAYNIDLSTIPGKIQARNKFFSVGSIEHLGKNIAVKVGESVGRLTELENLVIKKIGKKPILLKEVATINIVEEPSHIRSRYKGSQALVVSIYKESDANTVAISKNAMKLIRDYQIINDSDIELAILIEQSKQIEQAINGVVDSVVNGGILAAIVILIFLQSYSSTAIVALSIPMSLVVTLILMYFTGVSFNLMSLGGLALGVGMLVDNSIVVLENISNLKFQLDDPREAAIWGTKKVSGAILASTMTTIAVFAPLAFVQGSMGQMFRDISLTVVYSLISSYFVAVLVIPMFSSLEFKGKKSTKKNNDEKTRGKLKEIQNIINDIPNYLLPYKVIKKQILFSFFVLKSVFELVFIGGGGGIGLIIKYLFSIIEAVLRPIFFGIEKVISSTQTTLERSLKVVLTQRMKTFSIVLVLFIGSIIAFGMKGAELFPDEGSDRRKFVLMFENGQPLETTYTKVTLIEQEILKKKFVAEVVSTIGKGKESLAEITVRTHGPFDKVDALTIERVFAKVPSLKFTQVKEGMMGGGKPIVVEIFEPNMKLLKEYHDMAFSVMETADYITNLESSYIEDSSQLEVHFDSRSLALYKVTADAFVSKLKTLIGGLKGGKLVIEGEDLSTRIKIPRNTFARLNSIKYFSIVEGERKIYLDQVAKIKFKKVSGGVSRLNRKRLLSISADLNGFDLAQTSNQVREALTKKFKGKKVDWRIGGDDLQRKESEKSLIAAVCLSIFLIYLLLASQFENLVQPFIILFAVPLSIVGVAAILYAINMNVSALVFVGFIILAGISVNTSIVLVDTMNQNRLTGLPLNENVVRSSKNRLKPILMTACSTIIGLIPMAFATGEGSGMRQPLAVTVIGGLISSTILTLIVVPLIYQMIQSRGQDEIEAS